jgi:ACS family tartrate transporter-like MFS transporter
MSIDVARPASIESETIRRIAWRLLPFLMVSYFVSFLDRVNVGFAGLQMVKDLHLTQTVFGFGGGLFFVSYFLFGVPSNLLMEKTGARRWIALIMAGWGILAMAMALVVGPRSFYIMRLLLGALEAGFFPGVILYITYWFPREHRARIIGMFSVAIPASSFVGSPISAALLGVDGWLGFRGWQWMFIIEGAPAVLLGLSCLWVLNDRPANAEWLTTPQRDWLETKLRGEADSPNKKGELRLWQVLTSPDVLLLSLVLAGSTAVSSGLQIWQPLIIKSYGVTNMQTGLLNSLPFALASVLMVWWGNRSDRTGERVWHTVAPLALIAISLASALAFGSLFAVTVIFCLAVVGVYSGKGPAWALSTDYLSPRTAAAGVAQINAISNLAGFGTTYVVGYLKDLTGSYHIAMLPLAGLAAAGAVAALLLSKTSRQNATPIEVRAKTPAARL